MVDQINYLRSLEIEAAFVGEAKRKIKKCIMKSRGEGIALLFGVPESLTGDEKFRAMFSKDVYQKNTIAVACDEMHTSVHWQEH